MELEEYKFDHFKNIDEVMYYFNYWYKEEDVYSINRYLSLKDFNYISNKYQELQQENKQLKEQLLVTQTNEETFRLEMKDITQTLGLDEDTLFDDVKVYVRSLKDNWNELKEYIKETKLKEFEKSYGKRYGKTFTQAEVIVCNIIIDHMQELEKVDK